MGRQSSQDFRELARYYGVTEELYRFKAEILDRSYWVISVYWRIVLQYFRRVAIQTADGPADTVIDLAVVRDIVARNPIIMPRERQGCIEDIQLLELLTLRDHRKLFALTNTKFETPTEIDLVPIVQKLRKFCGWLSYRKMRFLARYDGSLTLEDLSNELFEAALVTLRNYDAEYSDSCKIYNFARKGAENHCVRLLEYHTTQSRGRLIQIKNKTEFAATTISMDQQVGPDGSATLQDILADRSVDLSQGFAERQWLCRLLSRVPQNVGRVVKITLGEQDQEFESWLQRNGIETHGLSDKALARKACQFLDVPLWDVQAALNQTKCLREAS
jgi:hypothetical protein